MVKKVIAKENQEPEISKSRVWVEVFNRILDYIGWIVLIGFIAIIMIVVNKRNKLFTLEQCINFCQYGFNQMEINLSNISGVSII